MQIAYLERNESNTITKTKSFDLFVIKFSKINSYTIKILLHYIFIIFLILLVFYSPLIVSFPTHKILTSQKKFKTPIEDDHYRESIFDF